MDPTPLPQMRNSVMTRSSSDMKESCLVSDARAIVCMSLKAARPNVPS